MSTKTFISRVKGIIQRIPEDKRLHLFTGFAISAVVSTFAGYIVGVITAVVAGAGKEAYDRITKKGTPEVLAFAYTLAGALAFVAISVVLTMLLTPLLCASL